MHENPRRERGVFATFSRLGLCMSSISLSMDLSSSLGPLQEGCEAMADKGVVSVPHEMFNKHMYSDLYRHLSIMT